MGTKEHSFSKATYCSFLTPKKWDIKVLQVDQGMLLQAMFTYCHHWPSLVDASSCQTPTPLLPRCAPPCLILTRAGPLCDSALHCSSNFYMPFLENPPCSSTTFLLKSFSPPTDQWLLQDKYNAFSICIVSEFKTVNKYVPKELINKTRKRKDCHSFTTRRNH